MFARRKNSGLSNFWPGYVDALATLVMVIVFVLLTFILSQVYLSDTLNNREGTINQLNSRIRLLDENLIAEKKRIAEVLKQVNSVERALDLTARDRDQAIDQQKTLAERIDDLQAKLKAVSDLLDQEAEKNKEDETIIRELGERLNHVLIQKNQELKALNDALLVSKSDNEKLEIENTKFKDLNRVHSYRSEFFTKLQKSLGNRSDMRIVGDRFVFQSEVLFDIGAADLGSEGRKKLNALAKTLKDITHKIPKDVNWILRVDGHTDKLPIRAQNISNWELSSDRAISVVKFLIKRGIPAHRLVAAGFGEHQPLVETKNRSEMARNRRIEFKLDQR